MHFELGIISKVKFWDESTIIILLSLRWGSKYLRIFDFKVKKLTYRILDNLQVTFDFSIIMVDSSQQFTFEMMPY